jgi:hypothetical protein
MRTCLRTETIFLVVLKTVSKRVLEVGQGVVGGGMCYFIGREGSKLERSREARVRIPSYTLPLLSLLVLPGLELLSSGYAGLPALSWRCKILFVRIGERDGRLLGSGQLNVTEPAHRVLECSP